MIPAGYRGDADAGRGPGPALLRRKEPGPGAAKRACEPSNPLGWQKFVVVSPTDLRDGVLLNLYSR